jgi:hypothetical protein
MMPLSSRNEPNYQHFEDVYFEKRVWVPSANISNYLMIFTRLYLGENDPLGKEALANLIMTLAESEVLPRVLVFWTHAVRMCVEGSALLPALAKIERAGSRVLVSAHALEAFHLKPALRAGKLANNLDLLEAINKAQKVVSF